MLETIIGYMLLYETELIMSSGTKKISFDPKTKNHVGNGVSIRPGVSNGIGIAGKPGFTLKKKTQVVQLQGQASLKTELGSPWGVRLKPIPSLRKTEAQIPVENPIPKAAIPKLSFKGPHNIEELNFKKTELKKVDIVKNKTKVRLRITYTNYRGIIYNND